MHIEGVIHFLGVACDKTVRYSTCSIYSAGLQEQKVTPRNNEKIRHIHHGIEKLLLYIARSYRFPSLNQFTDENGMVAL